jgi:putative SOS response-associated peptidase YedK
VLDLGVAQGLQKAALGPQLAAHVADLAIGPARQRPGRLGVLPDAVQLALDAGDVLLQSADPPLEVAGVGPARRVRRPPATGWAFRRTGTLEDMCGRYASIKAPADLADEFHAVDATEGVEPDYNVAPTKNIVAVVERHPRDAEGTPDPDSVERSLRVVKWGLVPYWAKDPKGGARMINARSESAAEKPAFRRALASRRCLIPADGWYEWQRGEDHKQPYYTHYADGRSLALAGLWEYWKPKDDPEGQYPDGLVTAAVLTAAAVGPLRQVHDRMPLVLPAEAWDTWLNPDVDAKDDAVAALLVPPSEELVASLDLRPVSPLVNSVRNNGPDLLRRDDDAAPLQLDLLT